MNTSNTIQPASVKSLGGTTRRALECLLQQANRRQPAEHPVRATRSLFIQKTIHQRRGRVIFIERFHVECEAVYIILPRWASRRWCAAQHPLPPIDLFGELPITWPYLLLPADLRDMSVMQERLNNLKLLPIQEQRVADFCLNDYTNSSTLRTLFDMLLKDSPAGNTHQARVDLVRAVLYAQQYVQLLTDGNATHHTQEPQRSMATIEDVRLRFISDLYDKMEPFFAARRRIFERVCPAYAANSKAAAEQSRILQTLASIPAHLETYISHASGEDTAEVLARWLSHYEATLAADPNKERHMQRMKEFLTSVAPQCLLVASKTEQAVSRILTKAHMVLTAAAASSTAATAPDIYSETGTTPRVKEFYSTPVVLGDSLHTTAQYATEFMIHREDLAPYPLLHPELYKIYTRKCVHYELCSLESDPEGLVESGNSVRWWCVFTGQPIETPLDGIYYIWFFDSLPPVVAVVSYSYAEQQMLNLREFFIQRHMHPDDTCHRMHKSAFEQLYTEYMRDMTCITGMDASESVRGEAAAATTAVGGATTPGSSGRRAVRCAAPQPPVAVQVRKRRTATTTTTTTSSTPKRMEDFGFMDELATAEPPQQPPRQASPSPAVAATAPVSSEAPGSPALVDMSANDTTTAVIAPKHEALPEERPVQPLQRSSSTMNLAAAAPQRMPVKSQQPPAFMSRKVAPGTIVEPEVVSKKSASAKRTQSTLSSSAGQQMQLTAGIPDQIMQAISIVVAREVKKGFSQYFGKSEEEAALVAPVHSCTDFEERSEEEDSGADMIGFLAPEDEVDSDSYHSAKSRTKRSSGKKSSKGGRSGSSSSKKHAKKKHRRRHSSSSDEEESSRSSDGSGSDDECCGSSSLSSSSSDGEKARKKSRIDTKKQKKKKEVSKKRKQATESEVDNGVVVYDSEGDDARERKHKRLRKSGESPSASISSAVPSPSSRKAPPAKQNQQRYYWTDPERVPSGYVCALQNNPVVELFNKMVAYVSKPENQAIAVEILKEAAAEKLPPKKSSKFMALREVRTVLAVLFQRKAAFLRDTETFELEPVEALDEEGAPDYERWARHVKWYLDDSHRAAVTFIRANNDLELLTELNVKSSTECLNSLSKLAKDILRELFYTA